MCSSRTEVSAQEIIIIIRRTAVLAVIARVLCCIHTKTSFALVVVHEKHQHFITHSTHTRARIMMRSPRGGHDEHFIRSFNTYIYIIL